MATVDTGLVMTRLVAVAGAAPGAGKSTLAAGLSDWMSACGLQVDHFREEDVLTRRVFAPLAREFSETGQVQLQTLLDTTTAYLTESYAHGTEVAVTDALVPFVPSLMGWGYSEEAIDCFLPQLARRIDAANPIIIYLDDDPAVAVPRAVAREDPGWLNWLLDKLGHYPVEPVIRDLETACAYLRQERDVTLRLLADLPWQVIMLSQSDPPSAGAVQRSARQQLADTLDTYEVLTTSTNTQL